ncbi:MULTISPECIES: hypothetical protein [unclassified Butyricimonas]|uniref:hypothetical protein n=1 Tax=unclassified Butyricimonas TaxID=2637652 RepID=UPI000C0708F0|nr:MULTISPECIES: hypothetical protein [unclassified Butyricimonas]
MNRISIILAISALLFCCVACEDEDGLSPSGLDVDRVQDLLDWSNPVVKRYYDDYGVALMTDFDENLDIKFNFYESWANRFWRNMEIGKMERKSECDSAIAVLDTAVFRYFKDELEFQGEVYRSDFKKKYFPNKILITNKLIVGTDVSGLIMQTVNRPSKTGAGSTFCQSNDNAIVVNLESGMLNISPEKFEQVTKAILYVMIIYAFEKYDLYSMIPDAFYEFSKPYYGKRVYQVQEELGEEQHAISRMEWVENYHMVVTSVGPTDNMFGFLATYPIPDAKRDVRICIDHLINPETIDGARVETENAPFVYQLDSRCSIKMWYIAQTLIKLGIDVMAISPDPNFREFISNKTQEDIDDITNNLF